LGNPKSFSARLLYKDGELRETARAFLREIYLEQAGGEFTEECWIFPSGKVNPEGYRYVIWDGRTTMAHRLIHELFIGPIPKGNYVIHGCDNPPCANPKHLRAGIPLENTADMFAKGRHRSGMAQRTRCPQDHEYSEENTYHFDGRRYCRACHKVYSRNYMRKKRVIT